MLRPPAWMTTFADAAWPRCSQPHRQATCCLTTTVSGKVAEDLELDEEIRMLSHGNYNSYYRAIEEKQLVEFSFVFNGSCDIQALMTQL